MVKVLMVVYVGDVVIGEVFELMLECGKNLIIIVDVNGS